MSLDGRGGRNPALFLHRRELTSKVLVFLFFQEVQTGVIESVSGGSEAPVAIDPSNQQRMRSRAVFQSKAGSPIG